MMKLLLTLIHIFMWMKSFLNYFALKMILLNILQNFAIYLFCFTHDNFSKWYISILQGKLKFLLLDKGSSTSCVCTKITKSRPPSPLLCHRTHLAWPLFMHTYFLYIHSLSLLINFYSDSSFCHSQFPGYFSFYVSLRLHFTKPISKRFLWFSIYSLRLAYTFQYTIINSIVIASFVQKKRKVSRFCVPKKISFCICLQPWNPLSLYNCTHLAWPLPSSFVTSTDVLFGWFLKKWMAVDIVNKNVFEIISMLNNLVLACRF